jgi:tetratricopeptide (TPR) repeat protein
MKCLAKRPEDRFQSMAELEAALCEAQIQAKLTTPWDDLPVPVAIDPARRERIIRDMPSPMAELDAGRRRPWLWVAIGGGAIGLLGVGLGAWLVLRPPSDEARDEVERISTEAMSAAARTYYVYPPLDDPSTATAYRKVLELEGLQGDADRLGDARGLALRSQFADTLVALGDRWWESEGSRRFAREFYVQALVFDDRNARALDRAGATPGMILDLRAAAGTGEFSEAMLANAQWLNTLAESDEAKLRARLEQELLARLESEKMMDELSIMGDAQMLEVARGMGIKVAKRPGTGTETPDGALDAGTGAAPGADLAAGAPGDADAVAMGADGVADTADSGEISDAAGGAGDAAGGGAADGSEASAGAGTASGGTKSASKSGTKRSEKLGGSTRDPERARELAKEGHSALSAGRRKDAESLFNQAIGYDSRCAEALIGLSDVYFDTGSDNKAVLYAEKAVGVASKNAGYRINLGDAYFKVLRYRDALEQYEKAKSLGSSKAQSRIDRVKSKLGE